MDVPMPTPVERPAIVRPLEAVRRVCDERGCRLVPPVETGGGGNPMAVLPGVDFPQPMPGPGHTVRYAPARDWLYPLRVYRPGWILGRRGR